MKRLISMIGLGKGNSLPEKKAALRIEPKQRNGAESGSVFFLHIPKTAGTTVRSILEDNLSVADVIRSRSVNEIARAMLEKKTDQDVSGAFEFRTRALSGHFPIHFRRFLPEPVRLMTFLRDPVALSVSYFHYQQKMGLIPDRVGIEQFVSTRAAASIMNGQCRWLAGVNEPGLPESDEDFVKTLSDEELSSLCEELSGPEIFQAAKKQLLNMEFVGLAEEMERSLDAMCATFGWMKPSLTPRFNVGGYSRESIPAEVFKKIEQYNQYDILLHDLARERLQEALEAPPCLVAAHDGSEYCGDYAVVTFSDPLSGSGWHLREVSPDGFYFRWAAKKAVLRVDVPLHAEKYYVLRLSVHNTMDQRNISEMDIFVDGERIPLQFLSDRTTFLGNGLLPAKPYRRDSVEIEFRVPYTLCPADVEPGNTDERTLGIAVRLISVFPF